MSTRATLGVGGFLKQLQVAATRKRFDLYQKASLEEKWLHINTALASLGRSSQGNTITPFYDSGDAYKSMWAAVDSAQHTVRWQTYICKNDQVGRTTTEKLIAAKKRGCKVELLYDSGGNMSGRSEMMAPLREAGIEVVEYRPFFPFILHYFNHGMQWPLSPGIRNHRKILVVDNKIGFVGGLNIGDDYAAKEVGGNGRFRDTQCRVEGPAVQHLISVMNNTLLSASGPGPSTVEEALNDESMRQRKAFQRWRHWCGRSLTFRSKLVSTSPSRKVARQRFRGVWSGQINLRAAKRRFQLLKESPAAQRGKDKWKEFREEWRKRISSSRVSRGARKLLESPRKSSSAEIARQRIKRIQEKGHELSQALKCSIADKLEGHRQRQRESDMLQQQLQAEAAANCGHAQVLTCSPPTRDWSIQMAFWVVVKKADNRVWITTPYFIPNRKLLNAVISAAKRGVDVRIMVGSATTSDPWFMWYVGQYVSHRLLSAGVKIYEFQEAGRVMHAKTVVVDSIWSSIGSYNWDILSNKLLEASVAGYDKQLAAEMENHFQRDIALSIEVTKDSFSIRPWYQRVACVCAYYALKVSEKMSFWDYKDADLSSRLD